MANTKIQVNSLDFGHISWKSYNLIKKKAMEQEFSLSAQSGWPGLLLSLSIAFFIVIACAQTLNLVHQSIIEQQKQYQQQSNYQIYHLEKTDNYLHREYISSDRMQYLPQLNLAYMDYEKLKNNYFI